MLRPLQYEGEKLSRHLVILDDLFLLIFFELHSIFLFFDLQKI